MTRLLLPLASLSAATLLAGCALPLTVYEGRYPMRDGWRKATVVRTVTDAELPAVLRPDCTDPASAASERQWVIVDYRQAGRPRRLAVPAQAGIQPTNGMPVYVQLRGCQSALAPRQAAD